MESKHPIFLDFNSTTPVDPAVLEEMIPFFNIHYGNPASITHLPGRFAADAVETARKRVSTFLNCEPGEIIFTSGSTESANMAISGIAEAIKVKGNHIITWATEHPAVLESCSNLAKKGFEVTILPVNRDGLPDLHELKKKIKKETILVAAMLANNETGVIFPIKEISAIVHDHQSLLFCDATQAPGKMRVDVNDLGADLLCISGHKMYGPKGTGALFLRRKNPRVKPEPLLYGGGHENGLRSGTLNVPGIIGMGKAASLCMERYWDDTSSMSYLRTILEQALTDNGRGYVNGNIKNRIPNTTSICFPGIKAATLLTKIPQIALATGSACSSALPAPSHVLKAMGMSEEDCYSSVRFSLGRSTHKDEILTTVDTLISILDTSD